MSNIYKPSLTITNMNNGKIITYLGIAGLILTPLKSERNINENTYFKKTKNIEIALTNLKPIIRTIEPATINLEALTVNTELEKYNNLVEYALKKSKKETIILINKSTYTLEIITKQKIIKQYPIELGRNPIDTKEKEGDNCTPEGIYHVEKKLPYGISIFHKALLLNYPTDKDIKKFKEKKASGLIENEVNIGGLIEIHGKGSGYKGNQWGNNWTEGCIAASNTDMDEIYKYASLNTPIIIVRYTNKKY